MNTMFATRPQSARDALIEKLQAAGYILRFHGSTPESYLQLMAVKPSGLVDTGSAQHPPLMITVTVNASHTPAAGHVERVNVELGAEIDGIFYRVEACPSSLQRLANRLSDVEVALLAAVRAMGAGHE